MIIVKEIFGHKKIDIAEAAVDPNCQDAEQRKRNGAMLWKSRGFLSIRYEIAAVLQSSGDKFKTLAEMESFIESCVTRCPQMQRGRKRPVFEQKTVWASCEGVFVSHKPPEFVAVDTKNDERKMWFLKKIEDIIARGTWPDEQALDEEDKVKVR